MAPITNIKKKKKKEKHPPFLKLIERGEYQDFTAFIEEEKFSLEKKIKIVELSVCQTPC